MHMRKVVLFIATSLDGFIAGKDGNIDWLYTDGDFGYSEFYKSIDTTLMGHNTYKDILQFGSFPYPDKRNFVFTRKEREPDQNPVAFITGGVANFVRELKSEKGKNIWLVGGGQINSILLNNNLIDQMIISIHPKVLGDGIPLFKNESLTNLEYRLENHKVFERGLVQLTYSPRY
jgi:dihydrofolate reductase